MIELREYKLEDWEAITDAVEPFSPIQDKDEMLKCTLNGIGVTGVEDGVVVTCGGIVFEDEENGTIWLRVSKKCLQNGYAWARTMRETFGDMKESSGLKISTYILGDFCKGEKLARLIGLKKTGETKENNGNLYYRFA